MSFVFHHGKLIANFCYSDSVTFTALLVRPLSTSVFKSGSQVIICLQEELYNTLTFNIGLAPISPGTICYHLSLPISLLVFLEAVPSKQSTLPKGRLFISTKTTTRLWQWPVCKLSYFPLSLTVVCTFRDTPTSSNIMLGMALSLHHSVLSKKPSMKSLLLSSSPLPLLSCLNHLDFLSLSRLLTLLKQLCNYETSS